MNPINTFADIMKSPVTYHGENAHGKFAFGSGSQLTTHIFDTLDEAIARFGNRISTNDREFKYSGPYQTGINDAFKYLSYAPMRSAGRQAVIEYGTGYIRGMLERADKPVVAPVAKAEIIPAPAPPPAPEPVIVETPAVAVEQPIARKRGRPRKVQPQLQELDEV